MIWGYPHFRKPQYPCELLEYGLLAYVLMISNDKLTLLCESQNLVGYASDLDVGLQC